MEGKGALATATGQHCGLCICSNWKKIFLNCVEKSTSGYFQARDQGTGYVDTNCCHWLVEYRPLEITDSPQNLYAERTLLKYYYNKNAQRLGV